MSRLDDVTYTVVAFLAVRRLLADHTVNCFEFTKAEYVKAYYTLARSGIIPRRKLETVVRNLRRHAAQAMVIRYARPEGGVYLACISALELDPRWHRLYERLADLARQPA